MRVRIPPMVRPYGRITTDYLLKLLKYEEKFLEPLGGRNGRQTLS